MNMNREKFDEIVEKMQELVSSFEKLCFEKNKFTLFLANGEILNISFLKVNIAHLLGVKTSYLQQANLFKSWMNEYDKLKYFLDNAYTFSNLVYKGKLNFNSMFSKDVYKKLDAFSQNINIRTDDMHYIIKYDSEKTYALGNENQDICDYYIIRKKGTNYYALGIANKGVGNFYLPVTSRKYDDYEQLSDFLKTLAKKQEFTYVNNLIINNNIQNYRSSFPISLDDKDSKLNLIISEAKKYDASVSVANDFSFTISKLKKYQSIFSGNNYILRSLGESLKNRTILDIETIDTTPNETEISKEILDLISTCNDILCDTSFNNSDIQNTYSQISNENKNLKEELIELKRKLEEKDKQIEKLSLSNSTLEKENSKCRESIQIIEDAYQKIKTL